MTRAGPRQAMIFAAGLGTRLRPLTDDRPKAMVEVAGKPLLGHVAERLVAVGVERLVINASPFAEQIERYVAQRAGFGIDTRVMVEEDGPLETGGGLAFVRDQFASEGAILLHNVDVISDIDLDALLRTHEAGSALATLAVKRRTTQRFLLFDDLGLVGRLDARVDERTLAREAQGASVAWPFCGIHVLEPALLQRITETGAFPITALYLRLAAEGARIAAHDVGEAAWFDVGTPERLECVEAWLAS